MSHSPIVSRLLLDKAIRFRALASIHGPEIFWEFLPATFMALYIIKKETPWSFLL